MSKPNAFRFYPKSFPNRKIQPIVCEGPKCYRKCLAVGLDLDNTLIHSFDSPLEAKKFVGHPDYYEFDVDGKVFQGTKRPHLKEFIDELYRISAIIVVFTASTRGYADKIVSIVFGQRPPDAVFTREDCLRIDGDLVKPLDLVYRQFPSLVRENLFVMIDDRVDVYNDQNRDNVINVKAWNSDNTDDKSLLDVLFHLNDFKTCNGDVRRNLRNLTQM